MEASVNNACPDSFVSTCLEEPSVQTTAVSAMDGRHAANPVTSADADSDTRSLGPALPVTTFPDGSEATTTTTRPLQSRPSGSLSTGFANTSTTTPSGSTPQTPAICSQARRSSDPASAPGFAGSNTRYPQRELDGVSFRAIAITLNPALCKRNSRTCCHSLDEMKSLHEAILVYNLRSRVISHMCETLTVEPGAAVLNADMPQRLHFRTVAERILRMSNPQSMN